MIMQFCMQPAREEPPGPGPGPGPGRAGPGMESLRLRKFAKFLSCHIEDTVNLGP